MKWFITSIVLGVAINTASAQTDTTFTYQAELMESGSLANGTFNVDFTLWDDALAGAQIGSPVMFNGLAIVNGRFTVELDYGPLAFDNTGRWLEVSINGSELSPRQPITRSPYSIQTRGIFVDDAGNVGIGTSAPIAPIHVENDGFYSILAKNTATSGQHHGGRFEVNSTGTFSTGVRGRAYGTTGVTFGVQGESDSMSGTGVKGTAIASSGTTYGVVGQSNSISGRGVYGLATASNGLTDGVFGLSNSTSGRGICGWAPASSGTTYGVVGQSDSTSGTGVRGYASASTGITYGVFGQTEGLGGRGVYGLAGAGTGGWFESGGTSGAALLGKATHSSGIDYGVIGLSASASGFDFYALGQGTDYGSSSSIRWKSNVVPISDPLRKLAQLRGVYFDWDEDHGGQHDVGMIAEEVGKVLPEIVNYEENGIDAIGMDYSKMTPLLVEAVNAMRVTHETELISIQTDNNSLRARIDELEYLVEQIAATLERE